MSRTELLDLIYDTDGKSKKLYKKDKNLYKYLYEKCFEEKYDLVNIPDEESNKNFKYQDELTSAQSMKLSLERPNVYLKYLNLDYSKKIAKEKESNKDEEDTKKLKDIIKTKLDSGTLESVTYHSNSLGKNAVVVIHGKEEVTKGMTIFGMRQAIAEVVKSLKNSEIPIDTVQIDLTYPVEDDKGNINKNFHVIKSSWSMNTVNNLSEDQLELLNTELDRYAESYTESPALR
ncbi:hypothetical protein [Staphylococcus aureus]|nr:hypothetical protein [Staphylococcus aureus]UXT08456.1 hypothetical protein MUA07_13855 [Staphylococcus aureus]